MLDVLIDGGRFHDWHHAISAENDATVAASSSVHAHGVDPHDFLGDLKQFDAGSKHGIASSFLKFLFPIKTAESNSDFSRDFNAQLGTQVGSGYWCSKGHHGDSEVVSWTGKLRGIRPVGGAVVDWAYSPDEFRISLRDGYAWHVAQDWTKPRPDEAFSEILRFKPMNADQMKIEMRHPREWGYYGINQAALTDE
jgi:hypothetical protein